MKTDIVITNYNRKAKVKAAINSALKYVNAYDGCVVLVDDASSDGSTESIKKHYAQEIICQKLKLVELSRNLGVTGAKNAGFMASTADWVVFLDSDDTLLECAIRPMQEVLLECIHTPLVFFRVQDQHGSLVGKSFDRPQWLGLARYITHTSYGEALVAVNRNIVVAAPYDNDLRGYEGIGCMRVIRDHGDALLSKVVARQYDRSGDDRLSSPLHFWRRAHLLARGHLRVLREFRAFLSLKQSALLLAKAVIYASMSLLVYKKK